MLIYQINITAKRNLSSGNIQMYKMYRQQNHVACPKQKEENKVHIISQ